MDSNTNNWKEFTLGNPQEEQPRRVEKRKKATTRRIIWLVASITVVVAAVAVVLLWDQSSFDGLRRSFIYARAEKDDSGCALLYRYDTETSGTFTVLEGSLVSVSQSRLCLQNENGDSIVDENLRFTHPAVADNGRRAVVYDVGGKELYVLSDKGVLWQKECDGEILSVTVNQKDQVVVTCNMVGYKAGVCVYDEAGDPLFEFDSSQRFCIAAAASDDGRYLGIVTMGREDSGFSCYLVIYRMNGHEPIATTELSGAFVYDLCWLDGEFCAVAENGLYFVSPNGTMTASHDFAGDYLHRVSLGNGYIAVLVSHYRSGSQCALTIVDKNGETVSRCELEGEVLSLSAAGRYIAVLYGDSLTIYNKVLEQEALLPDISEARQVVMRADGSAVLMGAESARLYLP